jgi:hypothetical protein
MEVDSPPQGDEAIDRAGGTPSPAAPRRVKLDVDSPEHFVWDRYGQFLVTKVQPSVYTRTDPSKHSYEVNLAEVQRLYLMQLRVRLAGHVAKWEESGGKKMRIGRNRQQEATQGNEPDEGCWEDDLHRYGK